MRYLQFNKEEWGRLRALTPLSLTEADLVELRGINERISLEEVTLVYLPLSRLLNLYVAATQPAIPTGFWDRTPKPTSGRLRRRLAAVHCADLEGLPEQLRKKQSPTAHLPKGVLGHRRRQQGKAVRYDMPLAA